MFVSFSLLSHFEIASAELRNVPKSKLSDDDVCSSIVLLRKGKNERPANLKISSYSVCGSLTIVSYFFNSNRPNNYVISIIGLFGIIDNNSYTRVAFIENIKSIKIVVEIITEMSRITAVLSKSTVIPK